MLAAFVSEIYDADGGALDFVGTVQDLSQVEILRIINVWADKEQLTGRSAQQRNLSFLDLQTFEKAAGSFRYEKRGQFIIEVWGKTLGFNHIEPLKIEDFAYHDVHYQPTEKK